MALKEMRVLAEKAIEDFQVLGMVVYHRVGEVPISEASVNIVAVSAHRKEALQAVAWAIDELKMKVPIWKKEFYEEDSEADTLHNHQIEEHKHECHGCGEAKWKQNPDQSHQAEAKNGDTAFVQLANEYLAKQKDDYLKGNSKIPFEDHLSLSDDQAKQALLQVNDQYKKGKINQQIFVILMKIYNAMTFKLTKQLMPSLKQNTISNLYHTLNYLFIYFVMIEEDKHDTYALDIAKQMLDIELEDDPTKKISFQNYLRDLKLEIKKDFPALKPVKKPKLKSPDQLKEEAMTVKKFLAMTPVIPDQAGEAYYIVAMDWFQKWKVYTGYDKVKILNDLDTPGSTTNGTDSTKYEEDEMMSDDFNKLQIHKDGETQQSKYPGPINHTPGFENLLIQESYLKHGYQQWDNHHIKTSCKEDEDFVILPSNAWKYLYEIYEGNELPRYSIELATENDGDDQQPTKKEFMIEIFYKKLQIYILPKVRNHLVLKKPSAVFMPRRATVLDFRRKIAEILFESKREGPSVEDLMGIARLWRLEYGENVTTIEREYDMETADNLPLALEGRILEDHEVLEDINVAESDVLLYEVKAHSYLKNNNCFAFIPKQMQQREKKSKNQILTAMGADNLTEEQLMILPLEKCLESKSKGGLTGLQNLGNTCFMNSVIQCLANTEPMAKYFIFGCYADHINKRNALGTRGRLAHAFQELLTDMYVGEQPYISPWDIKNVIARRAVQFQGFAQHDSQEMLSFLLETLHEDLNDVSVKPYVEQRDADGRSDEEVSREYWEGFKKRDKSLFVDLFYGQLKSRVQCTVCGKISISFDPFNMLSVPIPGCSKEYKLSVKFFPYNLEEQPIEFIFSVGEMISAQEIRSKIIENLPTEKKHTQMFIARVKDKSSIEIIGKDKLISTKNDKNYEICAYERPHITDGTSDHYTIIEVKVYQHKRSWILLSSVSPLTYPRLFIVDKRLQVRDLRLMIYKQFRHLIKTNEIPSLSPSRRKSMKEDKIIEEEYNWFFESKEAQSSSYEANNPLYAIYINNNIPTEPGLIYGYTQPACEFCDKVHKGSNCPFDIKDQATLRQVIGKMKHDRDFELIVQWNSNPLANLKPLEQMEFHVINLTNTNQAAQTQGKRGISIYDCISWFSQEETLTGNDKWYCSKCKEHQNALKKMEVYKAPEFLILHLKRFSHQRASLFGSRKIQEFIDYPVEGLDLTNYILEQSGKKKVIYDLYAVSNHYGSLNGGHYTAYAQNPINKRWYEFDDTDVSRIDPSKVPTKASYVLFYRRRKS